MTLQSIQSTLRPITHALKAAGVRRLGIFGSVLRDQETPASDIDILIELDPASRTYDSLYAIGDALETAFRRRVDLVTTDALSPYLGPKILQEVQYVEI